MDDFVNNAQKGIGKLFFWKKNKKTEEKNKNENKKINLNNENLVLNKKENKMTIKTEKNQNKNYNFDLDDDEEEEQTTSNSNNHLYQNFLNEINNEENEYFEEEEDSILNAHRVFTKKSFLDIEGMPYVPFIKIKKNENFLSILGIKKNIQFKEIKYLVLFDEHFIYMINMTIKENNQNNFFKKIGNHFDLKKLTKIDIKDDQKNSNIKIITLLFVLDNDVNNFKSKIKEFYFDYENGVKFFKILKFYLKKNNIPISFVNNNVERINKINSENDNKEDEKKEEEKKDEKEEEKNESNFIFQNIKSNIQEKTENYGKANTFNLSNQKRNNFGKMKEKKKIKKK
jgi:hypothetical protein